MTLADKITALRLVLAPVFFLVYRFPVSDGAPLWSFGGGGWTIPVLWALFAISELTDLVDGKVARARNEVSSFGKLFDPFADVLVRITYFLCFVMDGILPVIPLLLVLYREFSILFLRILMMKRGIAMGARKGGKIKAVAYMITGVAALLAFSAERLQVSPDFSSGLRLAGATLFVISTALALLSFADYVRVYRKQPPPLSAKTEP
jgi:CDP-diacylglycerol--glycerol-3-phosphate 3-phosphatidyltransferase